MVVFAYDHALGDGQSVLGFHHTLRTSLRSIRDPPSEHSGIVPSLPQDAKLPAALEDAMDTTVPVAMLLRELIKDQFPFVDRKRGKAWAGHPVQQRAPTLVTRVRLLEYTPAQASSLIKLACDHNATLTSTTHTLALVVLSRLIYSQPENKKYKYASSVIPMSLRRFTGAPPSAICNHVSTFKARNPLFYPAPCLTVSKESCPWDWTALPRSAPAVGFVRYLHGKYEEYVLVRLGKKRGAGLELSNLGAFPEPKAGEGPQSQWRIQQTFFAQASATLGAAIKVNVVGAGTGGLGICVTGAEGAAEDEFAEEFVKALDEGKLRTLAQ